MGWDHVGVLNRVIPLSAIGSLGPVTEESIHVGGPRGAEPAQHNTDASGAGLTALHPRWGWPRVATARAGSSRRGPRHGNLGMARGGHGLKLSPAQSSFGVIRPPFWMHAVAGVSAAAIAAATSRPECTDSEAHATLRLAGFNAAWWAPASGFASHKAASGPSPFPFRGPASLLSVVP